MFEPMPALIRLERERQGLTQEALAKLAKISRSRLSSLENGDGNLSLKLLIKVANTLGMTHIRVGGLQVEASPPELTIVMAAVDAIETARKVVEQATASKDDLERVSATMSTLLARVMTPVPDAGIARAAERLASSADAQAAGDALRKFVESTDHARAGEGSEPAAKGTARKRAR